MSNIKNKVLVVDDDKNIVLLLRHYLRQLDCEVFESHNGFDALNKLTKEDIDLMLLDVQMPGMDGYVVTDKVRRDERIKSLPIIIITALPEIEYCNEALESGANDFLTKPIDEELLIKKVKRFLDIE